MVDKRERRRSWHDRGAKHGANHSEESRRDQTHLIYEAREVLPMTEF